MVGADLSSVVAAARTVGQIRLAVLDSGLGGVNVLTTVVTHLQKSGPFPEADVTFVNVLPAWMNGYNTFPTPAVKAAVFDRALDAVASRFRPDVILVACNTLSVLAAQTPFASSGRVPVVDIVSAGLQLMKGVMDQYPDLPLAFFGTGTTVDSGVYQQGLHSHGIASARILPARCTDELTGAIEFGRLEVVDSLVRKHVRAVAERLRQAGMTTVIASLNCTHYPYFEGVFAEAFDAEKIVVLQMLNPNNHMADPLFSSDDTIPANPVVEYRIVTQAPLLPCHYGAMAKLLGRRAPHIVRAFHSHTWIPDLFAWEDLVSDRKPVPPPEEVEQTFLGRFGWGNRPV